MFHENLKNLCRFLTFLEIFPSLWSRSKRTISQHCRHCFQSHCRAFSQDDINLLEIPPPPDMRSVVGTNSSIGEKKISSRHGCKNPAHQHHSQLPHHHHHSHQCSHSLSTTLIENDYESTGADQDSMTTAKSTAREENTSINDLKNTIQKLENV